MDGPDTPEHGQEAAAPFQWQIMTSALVFLVVTLGLCWLMATQAESLLKNKLLDRIYFLACLTIGLSAALTLFNGLRSYARMSGKILSKKVEFGGPAALCLFVVILGFTLPPQADYCFSAAVNVHGPASKQDVVLRSQGKVWLDLGQERREAAIDAKGQAIFPGIPIAFRDTKVRSGFAGDNWVADPPDQELELAPDRALYLAVAQPVRWVVGRVMDPQGQPVAGATARGGDQSAATDAGGIFRLRAPSESEVHVYVSAPGFINASRWLRPNGQTTVLTLERPE